MTPIEIRNALDALAAEIGPKAYISLDIKCGSSYPEPISGWLYPDGITGNGISIRVGAYDYAEALRKLEAAWVEKRALRDKGTVRKMALAIIEISTDQGECSDAALRGAGFSQREIDAMGALACAEATRLAAGGPFSIIATRGANAEAA